MHFPPGAGVTIPSRRLIFVAKVFWMPLCEMFSPYFDLRSNPLFDCSSDSCNERQSIHLAQVSPRQQERLRRQLPRPHVQYGRFEPPQSPPPTGILRSELQTAPVRQPKCGPWVLRYHRAGPCQGLSGLSHLRFVLILTTGTSHPLRQGPRARGATDYRILAPRLPKKLTGQVCQRARGGPCVLELLPHRPLTHPSRQQQKNVLAALTRAPRSPPHKKNLAFLRGQGQTCERYKPCQLSASGSSTSVIDYRNLKQS